MRALSVVSLLPLALLAAGGPASTPSSAAAAAASEPGISVSFLPSPPTVIGRPTVMPIRVANNWPGRAVGVTLTVQTPVWVRLSARGCSRPRATLVCLLPDLAPGGDTTVRVQVMPTRLGAYRLIAQASAKTVQSSGGPAPERLLAAARAFQASIRPISPGLARTMTGVSWRRGCPVGLGDLRALTLSYWDFGGRVRSGLLIVHRDVAAQVVDIFGRLFALHFPIRRMTPVDAYGGDDYRSIEADNTSAFNCRPVAGTSRWSEHAYGRAIDLDPLENPYVSGGTTAHAASRRYLDRSLHLPGMIHAGDAIVRAFASARWGWGGWWNGDRDYQHFSATGR